MRFMRRLAMFAAVLGLSARADALDRDVVQDFENDAEGEPPAGWSIGQQTGQQGNWFVEGGALGLVGAGAGTGTGGTEDWIWFDRVFSGDIAFQFRINWPERPADDVGRHGGVSFFSSFPTAVKGSRYAGMTGYTMDWIDRASDHGIRFHKWVNGAEQALLPDLLFTGADPPELWRIEVHGDTMSIFLDDVPFQDIVNDSLRSGYIGFWQYLNNVHVDYDDLVVTLPDLVVNRQIPADLRNGASGTVKIVLEPYARRPEGPRGRARGPGPLRPVERRRGHRELHRLEPGDAHRHHHPHLHGQRGPDGQRGGLRRDGRPGRGRVCHLRRRGVQRRAINRNGSSSSGTTWARFAWAYPPVTTDHGPPGACNANGGLDLALDWIANEDDSIAEGRASCPSPAWSRALPTAGTA